MQDQREHLRARSIQVGKNIPLSKSSKIGRIFYGALCRWGEEESARDLSLWPSWRSWWVYGVPISQVLPSTMLLPTSFILPEDFDINPSDRYRSSRDVPLSDDECSIQGEEEEAIAPDDVVRDIDEEIRDGRSLRRRRISMSLGFRILYMRGSLDQLFS